MAYKEKIVVSEGYSCDICGDFIGKSKPSTELTLQYNKSLKLKLEGNIFEGRGFRSTDICGECVRVVSRALDLRIDPTDDECG
jgi:hypothetical protein